MATAVECVLKPVRRGACLRALTVFCGLAAVAWASFTFPKFWREQPMISASQQLVNGDIYSEAAVDSLKESANRIADSVPTPEALAALSIFRQWLAERAMLRNEPSQSRVADAKGAILSALSVAPMDSYQWLSLFWVSTKDGPFRSEFLRYLDMSYATGPNEGWVALRRSPLVLGLYPVLTSGLRRAALEEFAGLVRSHLYSQAAAIAANTTPNTRKAIVAKISSLPLPDRESFAHAADEKGITDLVMPGVETEPLRPWRQ